MDLTAKCTKNNPDLTHCVRPLDVSVLVVVHGCVSHQLLEQKVVLQDTLHRYSQKVAKMEPESHRMV